jgi:hypothetical protein
MMALSALFYESETRAVKTKQKKMGCELKR